MCGACKYPDSIEAKGGSRTAYYTIKEFVQGREFQIY